MSRISNWGWAEIVLLVGLFLAFVAGGFDAKTFSTLGLAVIVIFAILAFMNLANTRSLDNLDG